ncbi:roundabout homolog 3 isoform X2 [Amia ocellicauda]|uniref:roundabout homolog 3 isoform X2 n=1 Tax=Amia ocellicauda TaxID=2972642 RepID=UPI0034649B1D
MKVSQQLMEKANSMAICLFLWSLIHHYYFWDGRCSAELVFLSRPVDSVSLLGRPLVVPCSVYDTQTHQQLPVHWLKDTGDLDTWVHQLANGSLFFPSLREEDLGTYTCQASDGLSLINATVSISKAYLDGMFHSPMSQTVRAGDSVFFQCVSGDSLPPAQISWQKEGQLFTKGGQIQGEYGGGNYKKISGTLHIPAVSKEDEGKYVCVTYNSVLGVHLYSEPASLTVEVLPSRLVISQGPENLTVPLETEAVLHCSVQGFPFPVVQWYKNNQPLENRTHLRLEDQGQLLVFKNVSVEDEGSYYCEAQNGVDTVTSQAAYLLPAVMGWGFGQQPTNVTARRGSSITLTCRPPHSRPPASITWFKNNRVLNKMPHFMFQESGDLFFQRVQETDRGIYFCRASNPYVFRAVSSVKVHLNVLVPPNITISPETMTATLGSRVFFQCQASGSPSPSIVWYKQGQTIKTGGKITVGSQNITLYISAVRAYDEGTYTCEATNALGQSRLSATLRVAGDSNLFPCSFTE